MPDQECFGKRARHSGIGNNELPQYLHDDHAAFTVFTDGGGACYVREDLSNEVVCASDVDVHHEVEVIERKGVEITIENLWGLVLVAHTK